MRAKLIAFEGIDGSGKSTQARLLLNSLAPAALLHHPDYNGPIGQLIRSYLQRARELPPAALFQLYTADFLKDAQRIRDLLSGGSWVLLDRWLASAIAYQSAQGFSPARRIAELLPLPKPALTILLDIPASTAVSRIAHADRFETSERLLTAVAKNYRSLARSQRWLVLDGTQSREHIAEQIRAALRL